MRLFRADSRVVAQSALGALMATHISTSPFSSVAADFETALNWMSLKHGIQVNRTRFGKYQKELDQLVRSIISSDDSHLQNQADAYFDTLFEAGELIQIHKNYCLSDAKGLTEYLQEIASGPLRRADESSSHASIRARNTQFELLSGARFQAAGFTTDLSQLSDLTVECNKKLVHVECKRPSSKTKIISNLRNARAQCEKRIEKSESPSFGLIAVDCSLVANSGSKTLHFNDEPAMAAAFRGTQNKFVNEFVPLLKLHNHKRVLGLLIKFSCVASHHNIQQINYAEQWMFQINSNLNFENHFFAKSVAHGIRRGMQSGL